MSDIAVTMGPQGVQEVVNALHKIQQESNRTARAGADAAGGVAKISGAISSLKSAAVSLGGLYLANKFKELVKNAIEAADSIGDLASATGVSQETLSVVAYAAKQCGVEFGAVEKGVKAFALQLDKAKNGNAEAADTMRRLGVDAKELKNISFDDAFARAAETISMLDGSEAKVALANDAFSKAGMEMIEVCDRVGSEGFSKVKKDAKDAGAMVDEATSAAADSMVKSMGRMESQVNGLAMQFVQSFAPAAEQAFRGMSAEVANGQSVMKDFGWACGWVLKGLVSGVSLIVLQLRVAWAILSALPGMVKGTLQEISSWINFGGSIVAKFFGFNGMASESLVMAASMDQKAAKTFKETIDGAIADIKVAHAQWQATLQALGGQSGGNWWGDKSLNEMIVGAVKNSAKPGVIAAITPRPKGGGGGKDSEAARLQREREAYLKAEQEYLKAALENEAKLRQASLSAMVEGENEAYKQSTDGLENCLDEKLKLTREHYARLRGFEEERYAIETGLLGQELDQLESAPRGKTDAEELQRIQQIEAIRTAMGLKRIEHQEKINSLTRQELGDVREIDNAKTAKAKEVKESEYELAQKIAELQGKTDQVRSAELDHEIQQLREKLNLEMGSTSEVERQLAIYRQAREADNAYQTKQSNVERAFSQLDQDRQKIQNDMDGKRLSRLQGEQAILDLEKARIPILQELLDLQLAAAKATGNQALIDATLNQQAKLDAYKASLSAATVTFQTFKSQAIDAVADSLTNFFASGINNAKSFGDAMRSMALEVVQALQQIVAQMLINLMFQKLLGGIFGAIGGAAGGGTSVFGGSPSYSLASGGFVSGPGTGTSDSIPAMLSNGEFVVPARAVAQPGVLPALEQLRAGMNLSVAQPRFHRHRFAEGGLVTPGGGSGGGDNSSLTVALEEGLVLRALETPKGKRVLVKALADKRRTVRGVLG